MSSVVGRWVGAGVVLLGIAASRACDRPPGPSRAPPTCPPCDCKCSCADGTPATTPSVATTPAAGAGASREAIAEISDTIARKLAKRDGTCLADVDQLVKLDPGATRWAIMHRAQCSMLAGKCEAGKALMSKYFEETGQMLVEQIERSVEALASMYCTGPLDDRGELLRALTTLQKGAYQGNIGIRACSDAWNAVVRTRDRVKPKDDEDSQVTTAKTHGHYTAASCLGRAGDCNRAFAIYREGELEQPWTKSLTDPKQLDTLLRSNFGSIVHKCKGRIPGSG